MNPNGNQLHLIKHLCQFGTLDYQSCLQFLNSSDKIKASYIFRPLTKYKFISKHKNGFVTILAKGRNLFPDEKPLVTLGGGNNSRINSISQTAMWLSKSGVDVCAVPISEEHDCFIPSTCWRKIRDGILSTVRFTGMLMFGEYDRHRLAVYDIGDGTMEWQLRAERSLFYSRFHEEFSTTATGMLFICDEDKRIEIAKRIIRETMWRRKQLIEYESHYERERPVKYSKSPIRIAWHNLHVYLTTPKSLTEMINRIDEEKDCIEEIRENREDSNFLSKADFEDDYCRYFVNLTTDLLKYVHFFIEAKSSNNKYSIVVPKEDVSIVQMYPKIAEGVKIYVYR
jgi:hypothetical protein